MFTIWRGEWYPLVYRKKSHTHTHTQALYRGYRLRSRLRKLLENIHANGEEQTSDNVGGVADDDVMGGASVEVNFEEEIIVDYLDEVINYQYS